MKRRLELVSYSVPPLLPCLPSVPPSLLTLLPLLPSLPSLPPSLPPSLSPSLPPSLTHLLLMIPRLAICPPSVAFSPTPSTTPVSRPTLSDCLRRLLVGWAGMPKTLNVCESMSRDTQNVSRSKCMMWVKNCILKL